MGQLGSHWKEFYEIWYLSIFRKCVKKISNFNKIWQEKGSHWKEFYEIWYLSIFRKCAKKISNFNKIWQEKGYSTWKRAYVYDQILLDSSYNEKCFG